MTTEYHAPEIPQDPVLRQHGHAIDGLRSGERDVRGRRYEARGLGGERSRHAGIPAANICMNCHQYVTAALGAIREEERIAGEQGRDVVPVISPELQKLYDSLALDESLARNPAAAEQAIRWTRVHQLPDFVYFDHRPHVAAGVTCQRCHGPIEGMDRVRQFASLSMGWCVGCHRESGGTRLAGKPVDPSLDCVTCHF